MGGSAEVAMNLRGLLAQATLFGADAIVVDVEPGKPMRGIFCFRDHFTSFELDDEPDGFFEPITRTSKLHNAFAPYWGAIAQDGRWCEVMCEPLQSIEPGRTGLTFTIFVGDDSIISNDQPPPTVAPAEIVV
jgi:hypothetical protein